MQKNGQNKGSGDLDKDLRDYNEAFARMQITMWRDRMAAMKCVDTGALRNSVHTLPPQVQGLATTLVFDFIRYGMYVEAGVGNGYSKGNGGELLFLDRGIRDGIDKRELYHYDKRRSAGSKDHRYISSGKPRERRPWFSSAWNRSIRVMADKMLDMMGERFEGVFDDIADN